MDGGDVERASKQAMDTYQTRHSSLSVEHEQIVPGSAEQQSWAVVGSAVRRVAGLSADAVSRTPPGQRNDR